MNPAREALTLLACAGHLAIGALAAIYRARNPMAVPMMLLCADFFAFNAAPMAERMSPARGWAWLDAAASSMLAPLSIHLLLAFVGRRREFARTLAAAYLVHGLIAGVCALAFFPIGWARAFAHSSSWAFSVLASSMLFVGFALARVIPAHWRRNPDLLERTRTRVLLAAFATGMLLCPTELYADMGLPAPRLAHVGSLATAALFAVVTIRFRLFEREVSLLPALKAAVVGALSLAVYVAMFRYFASAYAMVVFGALTLGLGLVPALDDYVTTRTVERERARHMTTLGRFAAQMTHDLQNPMAAAKGAAQLLLRERGDDALSATQAEYVRLIHAQIERMSCVIEDYRRLGRFEPVPAPGDLAAAAAEVVAAQVNAAPEGVTLRLDAPAAVACCFDRDLVLRAIENLVRNAFEATRAGGGLVTVSAHDNGDGWADLQVRDTGEGMSPRVVEQALDDFFTTRPDGSGLGLSLVRRVAVAHGGRVVIDGAPGRGTVVTLRLAVEGPTRAVAGGRDR